jgi:hypothetical protein
MSHSSASHASQSREPVFPSSEIDHKVLKAGSPEQSCAHPYSPAQSHWNPHGTWPQAYADAALRVLKLSPPARPQ